MLIQPTVFFYVHGVPLRVTLKQLAQRPHSGYDKRVRNERYTEAPAIQPAPPSWAVLIGQQFGRLTVLGYTGVRTRFGQKKITCRCACGYYVDVMPNYLRTGNTTSCGCAHSESVAARNVSNTKHGAAIGRTVTILYRAWSGMKGRCLNPKHEHYKDYGGRGITIFPPWIAAFERFRDDVTREIGERPAERLYSFDRIDNNKGYEPGNIRWATAKEQNRNTRRNHLFALDGKKLTIPEWAEYYNTDPSLVYQRITKFGWSLQEALTVPSGGGESEEKGEHERLRGVWYMLMARCHNPSNRRYADYGGRGITVCSRWQESLQDFTKDVLLEIGERPTPNHSLDRIVNSKGYEPGNIRWATATEQVRNRRNILVFELDGVQRPLAEWCELAGANYNLVKKRVRVHGWTLNEALGTPNGFGRCPKNQRLKWKPEITEDSAVEDSPLSKSPAPTT